MARMTGEYGKECQCMQGILGYGATYQGVVLYTRVCKYGFLVQQYAGYCKRRVYKGVVQHTRVYQSMVKSMYQGDMQGPYTCCSCCCS